MKHTPKYWRWRDIWIDGVQLSAKNAREVEIAVNNHAALVEALTALVAIHDDPHHVTDSRTIDQARAALAAAKGGATP